MIQLFPPPTPAQRNAARQYEALRKAGRFYDASQLMKREYRKPEGGAGFMGEVFRIREYSNLN